ncbi:MAG TPA: biotin--[acetyl-CoA-carboxylase] ligase [Verrucomicrobiales bacterium]|nr:biotin--[acetyl-CoA-carboxylase] ligase [Verrucomicrobiales bacterium]
MVSAALQAEAIQRRLAELGSAWPWRILCLTETASTNDDVRLLAAEGAEEGAVVFAERQNHGRGRRGTHWFGVPGSHLLFSLLLTPPVPQQLWTRLTPLAALSVSRAIEDACRLRPDIKWPNDLLIQGGKVCGILTETFQPARSRAFAVTGAGLNVNGKLCDFPECLQQEATSLEAACGHPLDRARLAAGILRHWERLYPVAMTRFPEILAEVRLRTTLLGSVVSIHTAGKRLTGIAEDLGPEGELLLRTEDGQLQGVHHAHSLRSFPASP